MEDVEDWNPPPKTLLLDDDGCDTPPKATLVEEAV